MSPEGVAPKPSPAASDDELIERCLDAKQTASGAFDELYSRHAGPVLRFLYGLHRGDEHAARDALQETFVRFYRALGRFELGRPVRPWLLRIAHNVSRDMWKKQDRLPEPKDPEVLGERAGASASPGPVEAAAARERGLLLRQAVGQLPHDEQAVFLLKFEQGQTYDQVAEALSCSVRTAKYRMKAALERIGREAERLGVHA